MHDPFRPIFRCTVVVLLIALYIQGHLLERWCRIINDRLKLTYERLELYDRRAQP